MFVLVFGLALAGCRSETAFRQPDPDLNRMLEVPRYDIYEESRFFTNGMTMREPPAGTITYTAAVGDPEYLSGRKGERFVETFPIELSQAVLTRGQSRYERTCAACHGIDGSGNEMVTKHMRRPAPSLHEERIRELPVGQIFFVISSGYGFMPDYASHLDIPDRWAVVAYVRALQRSQYAPVAALSPELRAQLTRRLR